MIIIIGLWIERNKQDCLHKAIGRSDRRARRRRPSGSIEGEKQSRSFALSSWLPRASSIQ